MLTRDQAEARGLNAARGVFVAMLMGVSLIAAIVAAIMWLI